MNILVFHYDIKFSKHVQVKQVYEEMSSSLLMFFQVCQIEALKIF